MSYINAIVKIDQTTIVAAIFVIAVILAIYLLSNPSGKYDAFAKCLTEKEARMYGAFWCPHCKDEKEMFGSGWQYVNYTECSTPDATGQLPVCAEAGIKGYPTWVFGDGTRKSGLVSFDELSKKTGCELPS